MPGFGKITVALLPIGEGKTAMTPEQAAEAVNLMQPSLTIHIHDELDQGRKAEFAGLVNNQSRLELFHH
jgi:L-ascorbate metabolism protein UlaG (beta-lactamase superfamily)